MNPVQFTLDFALEASSHQPLIPILPFFFFLELTELAAAARGENKLSNAEQSTAKHTPRPSDYDSRQDDTGNKLRGLEKHLLKSTTLVSTPKIERRTSWRRPPKKEHPG
jgi:hypothetical protein